MNKENVLDDNVTITENNIVLLSQVIALSSLKKFQKYAYGANQAIYTMYKHLQYDIAYKKVSEPFTDAYDLVQEASFFLCKYLGHKLGEFHSISRTKKINSIRLACFKHLFSYLRKERLHIVNTEESKDFIENLPTIEDNIKNKPDYAKINKQVSLICNNTLEKQILYYLYNGVEVNNIAEFLNISIWKIYKRRKSFRDRFLSTCV